MRRRHACVFVVSKARVGYGKRFIGIVQARYATLLGVRSKARLGITAVHNTWYSEHWWIDMKTGHVFVDDPVGWESVGMKILRD